MGTDDTGGELHRGFHPADSSGAEPKAATSTQIAILNAALKLFARNRYEDVSLREIAREAGFDVALVGRHFESKDNLFTIALRQLLSPQALISGDRATFGRRHAEAILIDESDPAVALTPILALINAVTSASALPILQEISRELYMRPLADWLGGQDAELRADLISGLLSGALINRYIGAEHLRTPEGRERYIVRLAAALQHQVDG